MCLPGPRSSLYAQQLMRLLSRYNSIIFTTQSEVKYSLIAVSGSFLTGSPFSNTSSNNEGGFTQSELVELRDLASRNELTNMTNIECADLLSGTFNTDFQRVLLILDGQNSENSLVETTQAGTNFQTGNDMPISVSHNQISFDGTPVGFCLAQRSEPIEKACTIQLSIITFIVVLALNLTTLLITTLTLFLHRLRPLVTLGDAISSFLRDPDPTTRTNCLLTKQSLRSGMGGWGFSDGKYWTPKRDHMWFRSPSRTSWLVAGAWWLASAGLTLGALALTVSSQPASQPLSPFGVASPHTTYLLRPPPAAAPAALPARALAVAAAAPQLLLAGLYFAANALLTSYFLSRESSLYAVLDSDASRPLRVSADPEGRQTTSLYLTLPRPVSWVLAVLFACMGFVLSQACFVVSLSPATSSGDPGDASSITPQHQLGVGLSGVALVILLAMLIILMLVILGMGLLKAPSVSMYDGKTVGNPLVFEGGSCSAVISARCHRVPWEADVWKQKVSWGAVPEMPGAIVSHATFSARSLAELDDTRRYA